MKENKNPQSEVVDSEFASPRPKMENPCCLNGGASALSSGVGHLPIINQLVLIGLARHLASSASR